jgi:heme/copper-type cytochrome/quinol oxidase subunit 2
MNFWQLYWITRLDSICTLITVFLILILITIFIGGIIYFVEYQDRWTNEEDKKELKNKFKLINYLAIIEIIIILLSIFVPSQKDILTIYSAQWATNSDEVKKLPDNTVKAINKLLEDYTKEKSK